RKMQFYTRISEDLYVPVDLRIDVEGNSKELFFLLEGISRLDAFSRLEELSIESKEADTMRLRFRFFRPYFPSGDWIEERTDFSDKKKAVLKQGWLLWCWKSYRRQEQKWMNKEARRRQDFRLQLSAHLSEYRFHKQDIHWDIKKGFKEKIRQELR
ncbi:MAG: hypothetical protein VX278_01110, partial [Myxococcota bacterium]|nr:hypothetical protein [Myxococcota bacterium]